MDLKKIFAKVKSELFPTAEERAEQEKVSQIKQTKHYLSMAVIGKEYDHDAQMHYNAAVMMGGWGIGTGVGTVSIYKDFGSKAEQNAAITKLSDSLVGLGVSRDDINDLIKNAEDNKHKFDPHPYDVM